MAELLPLMSIPQVPPYARELLRDVKVTVLLGCDLDDVKLGQQVTVGQCKAISIQILPAGDEDVLCGVVVYLLWEWGVQVVVQPMELS